MKYFIDTEFIEGTQTPSFFLKGRLGSWIGAYKKPTIDLISIGIVAEDGREYYAISKDFNLKEAWNRCDLAKSGDNRGFDYWIRDNVLLPIYKEHISGDMRNRLDFSYSTMKWLLRIYGKSNKQISKEIIEFTNPDLGWHVSAYGSDLKNPNHPTYKHFEEHNVGVQFPLRGTAVFLRLFCIV